jgi:hypothetical protein
LKKAKRLHREEGEKPFAGWMKVSVTVDYAESTLSGGLWLGGRLNGLFSGFFGVLGAFAA